MTGQWLRKIRLDLGMSQAGFAESIGMKPRIIIYYEADQREIPLYVQLAAKQLLVEARRPQ